MCTRPILRLLTRWPRLLVGTLVAGACFVHSLPAFAAPAPLPEWGVKQKPAPLPDWDTAAKKPGEPAKKPKAKKPGPAATQPATTQPGPATTQPAATQPAATQPGPAIATEPEPVVVTEPEPVPEPEPAVTAPAEPVPAEPEPVVPAPTEPEPEPEPVGPTALERHKLAERSARGEIIVGGVLTVLGLGGVGAMTAGLLQEGGAEDDGRNTMIAAGAVSGAIGLALGVALLVDGVRDLKAARPGRSARVRVAPTFGGLLVSGRF